MFYLFSKGCEYAIKALLYVTARYPNENFSPKEVCRKAKIPEPFTRKVFQSLVRGRLLASVPGPGGGYRLTRHPGKITMLSVIRAVEGKVAYDQCVMGFLQCGDSHPCPIHDIWKEIRKKIFEKLGTKTLEEALCQSGRNRRSF